MKKELNAKHLAVNSYYDGNSHFMLKLHQTYNLHNVKLSMQGDN